MPFEAPFLLRLRYIPKFCVLCKIMRAIRNKMRYNLYEIIL